MTMHTGPHTDDTLRRDIAILSTLAHLHCATVLQLHALCFPYQTLATARITLYYLAEANFVIRTCWSLKRETRERGQIWTLTAKGHDLLRRYVHDVPALTFLDLARPSTSLQHEEWRVRLQVRTLVLRLLLEARRAPLLQCLDVLLPTTANWPTSWGGAPQVEPDALISIVWQPGTRKGGEWLPWLDDTRTVEDTRAYIRRSLQQFAENNGFQLGIWSEGQLAGAIGYHFWDWPDQKTEIGYWLGAEFQGRGIVTRACRVLVDFAFDELELNRVEIQCATDNVKSRAVPERLGFTLEGIFRQESRLYGRFVDHAMYAMLRHEWRAEG